MQLKKGGGIKKEGRVVDSGKEEGKKGGKERKNEVKLIKNVSINHHK